MTNHASGGIALRPTSAFKNLIQQPGIIVAPGAFNALIAKAIESLGFKVVYATGAGIANSTLGLPDVGMMSMGEILLQVNYIVNATSLPVIADIDTGYGGPVNVYRTVAEFEKAGVAALQIEDQVSPKRCGHFEGKAIIPAQEMVQKIKAALDARRDQDLVIIARTDALAVEGVERAIERAHLYLDTGADMTFVEAPASEEELARIGRELGPRAPQVANMMEGGVTPLVPTARLEQMGFKLVVYANSALRAALRQVMKVLRELRDAGTTAAVLDQMVTKPERDQITGLPWIQELEKRYAITESK